MSDVEGWEYYDEDTVLSSFWQLVKSQRGASEDPLHAWLHDFNHPRDEEDEELDVFHDYWRVKVPILLSPTFGKTCVTKTWNERDIRNQLIKPLEAFICASPDSDSVFRELGDVEPSVCGHQFVEGESCYFCRECAQDSTCVMCSTCFQNSEHRNHGYRMYTGDGGGLCDCGDPEAFNRFHVCSIHMVGVSKTSKSMPPLPDDLKKRAFTLLVKVVRYVFDKTSKKQKFDHIRVGQVYKDTWAELKHPLEFAKYCLVVANDYYHTYADVKRTLQHTVGCSDRTAEDLTKYIDKHGRAVVFVGGFSDCATIRDKIKGFSRRLSVREGRRLQCEILPSVVVAHQIFAARLLRWVVELFQKNSGFKTLFVQAIQSSQVLVKIRNGHEAKISIGEAVLLHDTKFWKELRSCWYAVLLNSVLKDYDAKKAFAKLYVKNYNTILEDFIADDQEADTSITHLSLQMFTVPSIAHELIQDCNAFRVLMDAFYSQLVEQVGDVLVLELWMEEATSEYYRAKVILDDLKYLLCKPPEQGVWNETMRSNFLSGARTLVKAMSLLQGVDGQKREADKHVEFEQTEWEYVFKLTINFRDVLSNVIKWCGNDKTTFNDVLNVTMEYIQKTLDSSASERLVRKQVEYGGELFTVTEFDLLKDEISTSTPLQRFLARLVTLFHKHSPTVYRHSKSKQRVTSRNSMCEIADPVLSTFGFLAQIESKLWRRNGMILNGMPSIFKVWVPFLREQDLLMLQSAVCLSDDPGEVMAILIDRFGLTGWVRGADPPGPPYNDETVTNSMVNEFLLLVIAVTCERYTVGVGLVSAYEEVRNRMVQLLSTGPSSYSEIVKQAKDDEEQFEEPLKEVADFKRSKKDPGKKVFEIKDEFRGQYHPYYFFYTNEQSSAAMTYQKEFCKAQKKPWFPMVPTFPPLTETFSGLANVVSSSPVVSFITSFLQRIGDDQSSLENDDVFLQAQKVLFLISVGCQDDLKSENGKRSFVKVAHDCQVFEQLSELSVPKRLKPMLLHTMERLTEARRSVLKISNDSQSLLAASSLTAAAATETEEVFARKRRAKAAAVRRAEILAQMEKSQKQFASMNATDLEGLSEDRGVSFPNSSPIANSDPASDDLVAAGVGRNPARWQNERHVCMVCQEERPVWLGNSDSDVLVMASYIHKSALLSQFHKGGDNSVCSELYLGTSMSCAPTISSCGHVMHSKCYQQFFDSLVAKDRTNLYAGGMNYDLNWQEFICPFCQRLCNNVLPLYPSLNTLFPLAEPSSSEFCKWVQNTKSLLSKKHRRNVDNPWYSMCSDAYVQVMQLTIDRKKAVPITTEFPGLPQNLKHMSLTFGLNTLKKSLSAEPFEEDGRVLHMCLQAVVMTIHQRMLNGNGTLTDRENTSLQSLARLSILLPFAAGKDGGKTLEGQLMNCFRSNAIHLLSSLLLGDQKTFADLDAFGVLVFLLVTYPSLLYPESDRPYLVGKHDHFLIQLCLVMNLVQVMIGFRADRDIAESDEHLVEDKAVSRLAKEVSERVGCSDMELARAKKLKGASFSCSQAVKAKLNHFLRCSAVFSHCVTDVPLPDCFGRSPGEFPEVAYQKLCVYLGIPTTIADLLGSAGVAQIIDRFLASEDLTRHAHIQCPPKKRSLITLPENYLDVLKIGDDYRCPNTSSRKAGSTHPSICLVCGGVICSLSLCCSKKISSEKTLGGCNFHAKNCTGGNGMFLRIRTAEVVLLSERNRGTILPAPYTDQYGESDLGLKRGNPLRLDRSAMDQLVHIWESNDIPDRISRTFDPEFGILRTNWLSI